MMLQTGVTDVAVVLEDYSSSRHAIGSPRRPHSCTVSARHQDGLGPFAAAWRYHPSGDLEPASYLACSRALKRHTVIPSYDITVVKAPSCSEWCVKCVFPLSIRHVCCSCLHGEPNRHCFPVLATPIYRPGRECLQHWVRLTAAGTVTHYRQRMLASLDHISRCTQTLHVDVWSSSGSSPVVDIPLLSGMLM